MIDFTHEYYFGSHLSKVSSDKCYKGTYDQESDTFAWIDKEGNIMGWCKEDGTKNEYNSYVKSL